MNVDKAFATVAAFDARVTCGQFKRGDRVRVPLKNGLYCMGRIVEFWPSLSTGKMHAVLKADNDRIFNAPVAGFVAE